MTVLQAHRTSYTWRSQKLTTRHDTTPHRTALIRAACNSVNPPARTLQDTSSTQCSGNNKNMRSVHVGGWYTGYTGPCTRGFPRVSLLHGRRPYAASDHVSAHARQQLNNATWPTSYCKDDTPYSLIANHLPTYPSVTDATLRLLAMVKCVKQWTTCQVSPCTAASSLSATGP